MGLSNSITDETVRINIVADSVKLIDDQVAAKSGISGVALKAAYKAVKGLGSDYIPRTINSLLPDIMAVLEPIWEEGVQAGDPVDYLTQNRDRTADVLLSITDNRIKRSNNQVVRTIYSKFRKSVKGDIEEAVPGLAKILQTRIPG